MVFPRFLQMADDLALSPAAHGIAHTSFQASWNYREVWKNSSRKLLAKVMVPIPRSVSKLKDEIKMQDDTISDEGLEYQE